MDITSHLTDEELLLALDDAPAERHRAAAVHVSHCVACQRRAETLRAFSEEFARLACTDDWTADAAGTRGRARLRTRLAEEWEARAAGAIWTSCAPMFAAVLATLVAAVLITAQMPRFQRDTDHADALSPARAAVRILPIRAVTPGATRPISASELCARMPWQAEPIPASTRTQVLRAYAMADTPDDEYELDYLVTPDLGGSPDARNLWPEPYGSDIWNARVKDELETLLPRLVCHGQLDLTTAQRDIATDWVAAYKKYFQTDRPVRQFTSRVRIGVESPFGAE